MAKKRSGVKWGQSDLKELQRAINNFNAKIYRETKRNPADKDLLPQRAKKSTILDRVTSVEELHAEIGALKAFKDKGALDRIKTTRGGSISKWEHDEFLRLQALMNKRNKELREKLGDVEVKSAGVGQGSTRRQMGRLKDFMLAEKNRDPAHTRRSEFTRLMMSMNNQLGSTNLNKRIEQMRENYIRGLRNAGFLDGFPEIEDMIRSVSMEEFYATAETDETATFDFYKDPITWDARMYSILEAWKSAYHRDRGEEYVRGDNRNKDGSLKKVEMRRLETIAENEGKKNDYLEYLRLHGFFEEFPDLEVYVRNFTPNDFAREVERDKTKQFETYAKEPMYRGVLAEAWKQAYLAQKGVRYTRQDGRTRSGNLRKKKKG